MSFSDVFGRISAVASSVTSPSYSGSIFISTIGRPSSSSISPTSPIWTPETRTVWPWPGIIACAVGSSAFSEIGSSSISGKRSRCWATM